MGYFLIFYSHNLTKALSRKPGRRVCVALAQLVKKVRLDLFDKLMQITKHLKKFCNLFD